MASIISRNNRYCVVYSYVDEQGNRKQKWQTFKTLPEAKARKTWPEPVLTIDSREPTRIDTFQYP